MRIRPSVPRLGGVLALLVLAACQQAPPPPQPSVVPPPPPAVQECIVANPYRAEGIASWYGRTHHGKETASGEIFNMHAMTAAHRSLPLGARIRVTNLENGRAVVLRVNDRGPYVRGRILDVTQEAADALGFTKNGHVKVRIEELAEC